MHPRFLEKIEQLAPKLDALLAMPPVKIDSLPKGMPSRGVYLFSEGSTHLYAGRSNDMRQRLAVHGRRSAMYGQAAFAFRLAREKSGKTIASHTPAGSRRDLMGDPAFANAFDQAKDRIRRMDVRYVEEADPPRQCLLEIYVAVALNTPYNDFDTH